MLTIEEFIIMVFCLIDDDLKGLSGGRRIRGRGPEAALADSEVITMEIVGEFLGQDADKSIWEYFRDHWQSLFPQLGSRTSFVRQAANLWYWKGKLQRQIATQLGAYADDCHLIDGFPIPVCRFARAHFSPLFKGEADYGYCASKKETYYGFEGHLLVSLDGIATSFTITAANVDERVALWELVDGVYGVIIGDKGYVSAPLKRDLAHSGIDLQALLRSNMHDDRPPEVVTMLKSVRRLIETVIGQFVERFHIEKVRARDLWHLSARLTRKLLSHTVACLVNVLHGRPALQFDGLLAH